MNDKINNTLFERKHYYVNILKASELLKNQMNEELLDGTIEASRLDEINHIYSLAFAGLLQEGLEYRYSRDTNVSKESFVMTIDHIDYRCRVVTLRNVLGNKLDDFLHNKPESSRRTVSAPKIEKPSKKEPDSIPEKAITDIEPESESANLNDVLLSGPEEEKNAAFEPKKEENSASDVNSFIEKELSDLFTPAKKHDSAKKNTWPFGSSKNEDTPDTPSVAESVTMPAPVTNEEKEEDEEEEEDSELADLLFSSLLKEIMNGETDEEENEEESSEEDKEEEDKDVVLNNTPGDKEEPRAERNFEFSEAPVSETIISEEPKEEVFDDVEMIEQEKHKDTLCYQTHRILINFTGREDAPKDEEIFFMVAPTQMERTAAFVASTPIVVYAYYRGASYCAGSFENGPNKNLVKMDVGDYSFLIRGMFNEYKFESFVLPTGDTSVQDIELKTVDSKLYNPAPNKVRNGHIHFSFDGRDEGEVGTIDAFPVGDKDPVFVVLHKISHPSSGEFAYKYCTDKGKKILIQTRDGIKEVICTWNKDKVRADIVPA